MGTCIRICLFADGAAPVHIHVDTCASTHAIFLYLPPTIRHQTGAILVTCCAENNTFAFSQKHADFLIYNSPAARVPTDKG